MVYPHLQDREWRQPHGEERCRLPDRVLDPSDANGDGTVDVTGWGAAVVELARAGVRSTIFEARSASGGMVSATIPGYRASAAAVARDLEAVAALGVRVEHGVKVGADPSVAGFLECGFDAVVVADALSFSARPPHDDIALIAIRFLG